MTHRLLSFCPVVFTVAERSEIPQGLSLHKYTGKQARTQNKDEASRVMFTPRLAVHSSFIMSLSNGSRSDVMPKCTYTKNIIDHKNLRRRQSILRNWVVFIPGTLTKCFVHCKCHQTRSKQWGSARYASWRVLTALERQDKKNPITAPSRQHCVVRGKDVDVPRLARPKQIVEKMLRVC